MRGKYLCFYSQYYSMRIMVMYWMAIYYRFLETRNPLVAREAKRVVYHFV